MKVGECLFERSEERHLERVRGHHVAKFELFRGFPGAERDHHKDLTRLIIFF
jgi:hypothetical protein